MSHGNTQSLVSLFLNGCHKYPDNTATVHYDFTSRSSATYKDLQVAMEKVNSCLIENCSEREFVGLMISSSCIMPAVLLGVMKVPAAFITIDQHITQVRLGWLIERLHIRVLIVSTTFKQDMISLLTKYSPSAINLEELGLTLIHLEMAREKFLHDIAYAITTSGTTGQPKLVKVPHQCIIPNITCLRDLYELSDKDIVLQFAPLTFDPSIVEIFTTLSVGARLVLCPDEVKRVPDKLMNVLTCEKVSVLQCTPSTFNRFKVKSIQTHLLGPGGTLRLLILGGEQFPSMSVLKTWMGCSTEAHNASRCCERVVNGRLKFINLYGITEVSCWASSYQVTPDDLMRDESRVCIGEALAGTVLSLSPETGELMIGGEHRVCLLNDEEELVHATLRPSGDLVHRENDGRLYFTGRADDQIKRSGKRMNLSELEQTVSSSELGIQQVCALWDADKESLTLCLCSVDSQHSNGSVDVRGKVMSIIRECFPQHYWPDAILLFASFPTTSHGKIDKNILLQLIIDLKTNDNIMLELTESSFEGAIVKLWKEHTGHLDGVTASPAEDNFILSGGTSLTAMHFSEAVQKLCSKQFPLLLELVINKTFSEVMNYVVNHKRLSEPPDKPLTKRTKYSDDQIRDHTVATDIVQSPRTPSNNRKSDFTFSVNRGCQIFTVKHGNDARVRKCSACEVDCSARPDSKRNGSDSQGAYVYYNSLETYRTAHRQCGRLWIHDTGKCVDASPTIAETSRGDAAVFIGSHSGRFSSVSLETGAVLWETLLRDRIESSAALSLCGCYVIVGCYDGCIYVMDSLSGDIYWRFETGDAVKSSPRVHPGSGLVYAGSHDHYVYCLNIVKKELVWKKDLDGSSVFASPCVSSCLSKLIVPTLAGNVWALNPDNGEIVWVFRCQKPVFSSPAVTDCTVYIGCVDGSLYSLDVTAGTMLWKYDTSGPIFSSPSILHVGPSSGSKGGLKHATNLSDQENIDGRRAKNFRTVDHIGGERQRLNETRNCHSDRQTLTSRTASRPKEATDSSSVPQEYDHCVIFGSHDCHGYCISSRGSLVWKFRASSPVFSIPFIYNSRNSSSPITICSVGQSLPNCDETFVFLAETKGLLHVLKAKNGTLVSEASFPGDVFSSPVVHASHVVVGCRDDNVYCLKFG